MASIATASWYHCSVKPISRSTGRTAIAAAAYRTGTRLHDDQLQKTYDYTRRRGVETSFIVAPAGAPEWAYNLESLWNEAQAKDNRVNSRMAREVEFALPSSLDASDREQIARDFALHLVDRYGVAVSVALHEPGRQGDDRNYHAHIMFTTRRIDENGFGAKTRELDDKVTGGQEIEHIREYAATLINEYLEDAGVDERVDHRSFKDRGIDKTPTEHLGVEAAAMERRGEESDRGDRNREIAEHNHQMDNLVNELAAVEAEISGEMEKSFLPSAQEEDRQARRAALTWEEQKHAAQSAFNSPVAEAYINAIQETGKVKEYESMVGDRNSEIETQNHQVEKEREPEIQAGQVEQPTLSWEEQKHAAQSAINSPIAKSYEDNIKDRGEIREFGLGKSWYNQTVTTFENLYYGTMERIRDTWQKYVGRYISPAQDRDIELDR